MASLPNSPLIHKTWKQTNSNTYMYIYTNRHISTKIMNNNVVSDKLKVYFSLMSNDTFDIYIVHRMYSDEHIKIVFVHKTQIKDFNIKVVSKMKYVLSYLFQIYSRKFLVNEPDVN